MRQVSIGSIQVSRLILGSNPFSGFSHKGKEMDFAMRSYYSTDQILKVMSQSEQLGINTQVARIDDRMTEIFKKYWEIGGKIQWFAQSCPELGDPRISADRAVEIGAKACYIHGGVMDHLYSQHNMHEIPRYIEHIKQSGLLAGVAGHLPGVFAWAEENLDVDFYMCSYYNPISRHQSPEHISGTMELFTDEDRDTMVSRIASLTRPVIHYKILAAGRNNPLEALTYSSRYLRENDAICIGIFDQDHPGMIEENVKNLQTLGVV
jgi:hypothetical protein